MSARILTGRHGPKRGDAHGLGEIQAGNRAWWESTPMTYRWQAADGLQPLSEAWFDDQDRRSAEAHADFATDTLPFDRVIPYSTLRGKRVLEIGVGSGFHSELLARAGAIVTGIDLTDAAIERTRARFELRGLEGTFERWDAETDRAPFERSFDFVWSWGVVHHSSRTARIVRNVERWLADGGRFSGMVYHRNSTSAALAVLREGVLRGRLGSKSVDELLWRGSDGFSARFYPADQWRDLLLAFFADVDVRVAGIDSDVVPLPRAVRPYVLQRIPQQRRTRILERRGSFLVFDARGPVRA